MRSLMKNETPNETRYLAPRAEAKTPREAVTENRNFWSE